MNTNLIHRNNNIYEINVQFIEIINKKVKELIEINDFRNNILEINDKFKNEYLEKYFELNANREESEWFLMNAIVLSKIKSEEINENKKNEVLRNNKRKRKTCLRYKCEECLFATSIKSNFDRHILEKHLERKPFECLYCDYRTSRSERLTTHLDNCHNNEHNLEKTFKCDWNECEMSFISLSSLRQHRLSHSLLCKLCKKGFKSKFHLTQHVLTHSNVRNIECEHCCYRARFKKDMMDHMKAIHTELLPKHIFDKLLECKVCGKRFQSASKLKRHQNIHIGFKPFKCNKCSYSTASKQHLERHNRKINHNQYNRTEGYQMEYKKYMSKINDNSGNRLSN
jgi:uncharacterized Zn-finger protein